MRALRYILFVLCFALLGACNGDVALPQVDGVISIAHLCGMAKSRSMPIKENLIVRGYVVANDYLGELVGAVVIDDGSGGVKVMVEADKVATYLPLHSSVTLYCSGLYMGRMGGGIVIGERPTSDFVVDRISENRIFDYMAVDDAVAAPKPLRRNIEDIGRADVYRYVVVGGVSFVPQEQGLTWCDKDHETGFYLNSIRHLTNGEVVIPLVVSKECAYASEVLPPHTFECEAVVDIYDGEVSLRITNHCVDGAVL